MISSPIYRALLLAVAMLLLTNQGQCWKCHKDETVCEIWLELEHGLTMMKGKSLITLKDGLLFPYDTVNLTRENAIPKEQVITGDGFPEPMVVIMVNGTVPGPVIEVYENQTVRVHLHNKMASESTSLHFHGQVQNSTPWMDGVAFVSQCPILPGQTFIHQFKAEPAGTYWYHSHSGGQTSMGMFGGLVVHPRSRPNEPRYHDDFTLLIMDWNHDWSDTMTFMKMQYGMYVKGKKEGAASNLSGAHYSMFRIQSALINGRGRYTDPETSLHNGAPLEVFTVRRWNLYRFRLINSGSVFPFKLSVDGHKLKVVATDGMELDTPVMADSIIITPGERYDFELTASDVAANYWIRAKSLERDVNHAAEAILHYEGAPNNTDPTSRERDCTEDEPCTVINCPFHHYPASAHTKCINVEKLRASEKMPHHIGAGATNVKEYFLNWAFPGTTWTPASVNGIQMELPHVSALTQPLEFATRCPNEGYKCTEDQVCRCTAVLDLHGGDVVQMVLTNQGRGKGWDHPIHMHGHSFFVLKIGYPEYDNVTGKFIRDNMDINCRGNSDRDLSYCNNATWTNSSWSGNSVPGLELEKPMLKDTVNVPTGGYVVIRIQANNPGVWPMHCHVSLHLSDGMFLLLNESYPNHPPPPPGFRQCGDFSVPYPAVPTIPKPVAHHDVKCGQTDMSFSVPVNFPSVPKGVTLSDPQCLVNGAGSHLVGHTSLNDCGTSVRFTNDTVVFSNFIIIPPTDSDNNKTGYVEKIIPIECTYNRTADLQLTYLPVVRRVLFTETGVGQFQFQIEQFRDASFASKVAESSYPLKMRPSEEIYIQLSLADSALQGKEGDYGMDVLSCVASSSSSMMAVDDKTSQDLIRDSCPASGDVHLFSGNQSEAGGQNASSRHFRFSFKPVVLSNSTNPQQSSPGLVYIHCRVQVCPAQSCHTQGQCHQTPYSASGRVRRAVSELGRGSSSSAHHLSTGPLLISPDSDAVKSSASSPMVMVMGAIAGMATLVAIAVIVAWTRSRRAEGHRLLKVEQ